MAKKLLVFPEILFKNFDQFFKGLIQFNHSSTDNKIWEKTNIHNLYRILASHFVNLYFFMHISLNFMIYWYIQGSAGSNQISCFERLKPLNWCIQIRSMVLPAKISWFDLKQDLIFFTFYIFLVLSVGNFFLEFRF